MLLPLIHGARGLNTRIDPVRTPFNLEQGLVYLAKAINVDIDDSGRISRRKGQTQVDSSAWHSLFNASLYMVGVSGDVLSIIDAGYNPTPLRNVTVGARMSYALVDGICFYTNGHETGKIISGTSYVWQYTDSLVGVTTTRKLYDPPVGELLAYYRGRMYVVQGKTAYYSEPFDLDRFRLRTNFIDEQSLITMIRPVADGIYIADSDRTRFYAGMSPKDPFDIVQVLDVPVAKYSDIEIYAHAGFSQDGEPFIDGTSGPRSAIWRTQEGDVIFGGPSGQVINLSKHKIDFPTALTGSSAFWNNKLISLLNP